MATDENRTLAVGVERPQSKLATARVGFPPRGRTVTLPRVLLLLLAFLSSAAAGYQGYQRFWPTTSPSALATTVPVRRGTIAATITVAGSTTAISQAKLAFEGAGRLAELKVKLGDSVKEGDVLARLDSADLEIQVAQAEVALEQAKMKLDQLKEGPKEVEVAAARASYESAANKYNELKAGAKPEDVAAAEAAVRDAQVALANAQNNLVLVQKSATVSRNVRDRENEHSYYEAKYGDALQAQKEGRASQTDVDNAWSNLLTAKENLDSARAEAEMALRKAENDVAKAQDGLRQAQDTLDKLRTGPTAEELKAAEAAMLNAQAQLEAKTAGTPAADISAQEVAVRLAEATLKQRQILLEKATLRAPFDGVIDAISVNAGEQVSAAEEVMAIVNMKQFRIDARVDEIDVARLAPGQTAVVTLDSLPDERLTARVAFVGASAVVQQGVVSYPVILDLETSQAPVRPGMTASAAVEVARRENVLLVPNRAIRTQGRSRTVEVMVDGKPETRTVSVGMSNDQLTEVLDGLREADSVVIPSTTTAAPRVPQAGGFGPIPAAGGGGR